MNCALTHIHALYTDRYKRMFARTKKRFDNDCVIGHEKYSHDLCLSIGNFIIKINLKDVLLIKVI